MAVAIRLVLAEDHYLVREGVRRLLETHPDVEVAATCGDLESLLAAVEAEHPDVVITDIRMPPHESDEGIQAAERLREAHPEVSVVLLPDPNGRASAAHCRTFEDRKSVEQVK